MTDGLSLLGVDWSDITKGLSGMLSTTGDLMQTGSRKGQEQTAALLAEKQRMEDERQRRQTEAANKRLALGIGAGVVGLLGAAFILKKK